MVGLESAADDGGAERSQGVDRPTGHIGSHRGAFVVLEYRIPDAQLPVAHIDRAAAALELRPLRAGGRRRWNRRAAGGPILQGHVLNGYRRLRGLPIGGIIVQQARGPSPIERDVPLGIDGRIDVSAQCLLGRQRYSGRATAIETDDSAFGQRIGEGCFRAARRSAGTDGHGGSTSVCRERYWADRRRA